MSNERATILLFEDDDNIVAEFRKRITPDLDGDLELEVFPLNRPPVETDSPYEDRVENAVRKSVYLSRLTLIVTDRDLSTKSEHWRGLSQAAVSAAARKLGVPVACYRKKRPNIADEFTRIPGDGLIELPENVAKRARRTVILARGFVDLALKIADADTKADKKSRRKIEEARASSPGGLLAGVLGQPSASAHFDTFACGDQLAIGEILKISPDDKKISPAIQRRLVAALGVWLADLVMKYPGVLVGTKAAASYLDVAPAVFARKDVQAIFAPSRYVSLPFADEDAPMWWRHLLDEITSENDCVTGLEVCEKKGLKKLKFCPCSVDGKLHAGYFCMATEEPISAENSSGRVKWFPPGADLARLNKATYRKLAPWIGT